MLGKRIKMGHYINVNKLKWKGGRLKREKIYVYLTLDWGFPGSSAGKESACNETLV